MMSKINSKGMFPLIGVFGIIALVIAPIVVAYMMATIMPGMPMILYVIIGFALIFIMDYFIVTLIFHLPMPLAMAASMLLPFLQEGIALSVAMV